MKNGAFSFEIDHVVGSLFPTLLIGLLILNLVKKGILMGGINEHLVYLICKGNFVIFNSLRPFCGKRKK